MSKERYETSSLYAIVTDIHQRVDELAATVQSAREELEQGETLTAVNITLSRLQEMRELVALSEALMLVRRSSKP